MHVTDQRGYVYATRDVIRAPGNGQPFSASTEVLRSGHRATVCPQTAHANGSATSPFDQTERGIAFCWSDKTGFYGAGWRGYGVGKHQLGFFIRFPFPFLLAAIDPGAEAKLDGVSNTIVSGRYLRAGDEPRTENVSGVARLGVPVIVSTRPYMDDRDQVTVRELSAAAARAMAHDRTLHEVDRTLARGGRGSIVLRRPVALASAYRGLLKAITPGRSRSCRTTGPAARSDTADSAHARSRRSRSPIRSRCGDRTTCRLGSPSPRSTPR